MIKVCKVHAVRQVVQVPQVKMASLAFPVRLVCLATRVPWALLVLLVLKVSLVPGDPMACPVVPVSQV